MGATVEQTIEVLDDAIRWSLEYDDNGCDIPVWMGIKKALFFLGAKLFEVLAIDYGAHADESI